MGCKLAPLVHTVYASPPQALRQGGEGYPVFTPRVTTQNIKDQVLADYLTANTPVSPAIQGRIVCTTSGATACPVVTP